MRRVLKFLCDILFVFAFGSMTVGTAPGTTWLPRVGKGE
jgi:hypothetical protein